MRRIVVDDRKPSARLAGAAPRPLDASRSPAVLVSPRHLRPLPRALAWLLVLAAATSMVGVRSAHAEQPLRLRIDDTSLVVPRSVVSDAYDVDPARTVTMRSASGATRTVQSGGASVRSFLSRLGLPIDAISEVTVQRSAGRAVVVSGSELREGFGGDPACPACQATFETSSVLPTVNFLRPLRDASDANDLDRLTLTAGQPLYVGVSARAASLIVQTQRSVRVPRLGEDVTFVASADAPADAQYTWFFGDGTIATGAKQTHRFQRSGHWPTGVLVTSRTAFGAANLSTRVRRAKEKAPTKDPTAIDPSPTATPPAAGSPAPAASPGASAPPAAAVSTAAPAPATPQPSPSPTPSPTSLPTSQPATMIRGQLVERDARVRSLAGALTAAEALAAADRAPAPRPDAAPHDGSLLTGSATSGMLLLGLLSAGALSERRRAHRAFDPLD